MSEKAKEESKIEREKKANALGLYKAKALAGQERQISGAETAAQSTLKGTRLALGALAHRCGDLEEARVKLADAEAAVAKIGDGPMKAKLKARLSGAKKIVDETAQVCGVIHKEPEKE